ncbi:MAG TPA: C1 family peptidase, partial [Bacteroidales bacterium]|nr:C1 family peptidase [Bacteroidales bacterium]
MKHILFSLVLLLLPFLLSAQNISPEVLKKLQENYKASEPDKAAINALMSNDLKSLTVNAANCVKPDAYFKYRVKSAGITDQKSSGHCWLFASLNVYRP